MCLVPPRAPQAKMDADYFDLPKSLEEARIYGLPDAAYYIPSFLSENEEVRLLEQIENRPSREWTGLSKRRLQNHPAKLSNGKLIEAPLPPWLSQPVITRLLSIPVQAEDDIPYSENEKTRDHVFSGSPHHTPNHCLINEYLPGQGIMPHEDGPAYHPVVATVSLGAPIVLDLYTKDAEGIPSKKPRYRIMQEARSLLILTGAIYTDYLHGIALVERDVEINRESIINWQMLGGTDDFENQIYVRKTRTSLTFRDVKGVIKLSKLVPGLIFGR